ncbi:MAG: MBL fold metallo-hydrolase, partial [Acidimicrobiia bacterium]
MVREIAAAELAARLGTDAEPFVVDVREPDEVAEWPMPGARNIPLGELHRRIEEVPADREVVAVCASGNRSMEAAHLLTATGRNVASLAGGMFAWAALHDTATVEFDGVRVVQIRRRGKGCLSYVIGAGEEAFVVDPSLRTEVYRKVAADNGWRIVRVFDTHLHADHLSGARALAAETGASLHLNPADTFHFPFEPLHDGQRFELPGGTEVAVATLHTPGHTQGSTIYVVGDRAVLTGD